MQFAWCGLVLRALALIYMTITGILVFAFGRIEARIPNKIG